MIAIQETRYARSISIFYLFYDFFFFYFVAGSPLLLLCSFLSFSFFLVGASDEGSGWGLGSGSWAEWLGWVWVWCIDVGRGKGVRWGFGVRELGFQDFGDLAVRVAVGVPVVVDGWIRV